MGNSVLPRLESLRKRNDANSKAVNKDLYRLLCNPELLTLAYNLIKSKPGNETPGTDGQTLDGMSQKLIDSIVTELRNQSFQFKPVRRVFIPKQKKGSYRPLGIPSPRDKVVQKAMLIIMECIYEPVFSDHSHGFRPGRSCHSALREVRATWSGVKWIIEGDIQGCYDNVNHHTLMTILRRKIQDERFLQLIWKLLRAGTEVEGRLERSKLGTPQGGILSPLLANIYLNELDTFLEGVSASVSAKSAPTRRENPEYRKVRGKIYRLRKKRTRFGILRRKVSAQRVVELRRLQSLQRRIPSKDPFDPKYKKVVFLRYADDWIVGIIGSKREARAIKETIEGFLQEHLQLQLSPDKTKISLGSSRTVQFLGYELQMGGISRYASGAEVRNRRSTGWQPRLFVPMDKVVRKLSDLNFCTYDGRGIKKKGWIVYPDDIIVAKYNYIIRGLRNYYAPADNFGTSMNRIEYILKYSCAHTLAAKHRTRISKQLRRFKEGKLPLDVRKSHTNKLWDFKQNPFEYDQIFRSYAKRTKFLNASQCKICQSTEQLEMHHVKALKKDGVLLADKYLVAMMQRMNRKQICVCRSCHMSIHNGKYDGNSLSLLD
jgi:group II intron reverse transcriptase/maturase